MTAPANRWKLGLFVVGGAVVGLLGVAWLGARELRRSTHLVYAYFDEALTGLEQGSAVRFRGVTVGVVDRIRFASDKKHLEVQVAVYDDYLSDLGLSADNLDSEDSLVERLRAQVVMSWVTSTAFIQVDYFPDPSRGPQVLPFAAPSDAPTIRTVPSTAKSLESSAREVLDELPRVARSAREVVELFRSELVAAQLPDLSRRLQGLLGKLEQQVDAFERQDTAGLVAEALREVTATGAALRGEQGTLHEALTEWTETARSLRTELEALPLSELAADVGGGVREIAGSARDLQADVRGELQQLRRTLQAVERLARALERDPGALLRGRGDGGSPLEGGR